MHSFGIKSNVDRYVGGRLHCQVGFVNLCRFSYDKGILIRCRCNFGLVDIKISHIIKYAVRITNTPDLDKKSSAFCKICFGFVGEGQIKDFRLTAVHHMLVSFVIINKMFILIHIGV